MPRLERPFFAADSREFHHSEAWRRRLKVELFPPDSVTEPRYWVRDDEALAMMLGHAAR